MISARIRTGWLFGAVGVLLSSVAGCSGGGMEAEEEGAVSASSEELARCVRGTRRCINNGTQAQVCNSAGQWGTPTPCAFGCSSGSCLACAPGSTRCASSTSMQTCSSSGQWGTTAACANGCASGACLECVAGTTECVSSNTLRTCSANGRWGATVVCPGACSAGRC